MRKHFPVLLAAVLLSGVAGCAGVDTLRLTQDRPEDLELLLEQHEYARVRQLTGKYPSLDSPAIQQAITQQETDYVDATHTAALALESEQDLLGAVQLLSGALQRVPHSAQLRELRNSLEQERVRQLKTNEREQLVARASYMIDQQQLYRQQANLEEPSLVQRWENTRNEKAALEVSAKLVEHGEYALRQEDLKNAQLCLDLSLALHATAEAQSLLAEVTAAKSSQHQQAQQEASVRQVRKQQKIQKKKQQKTEVLLAETQQALENNDLQVARSAFIQIPASASNSSEVKAVQTDLDQALDTQVATLMARGDSEYRADKVLEAVETWEQARALDPDNPELKQRIDRANKVLAHLEKLKSRQPR
jgi:hypothetical protein